MWQIVDALRTSAGHLDVRGAFIELAAPELPAVLGSIPGGSRVVLVPLLLASGYHDRVDLPAVVARTRPDTVRAAVLGPDPLLAVALADRLVQAGWRPGDAVVLAGAGSSDPDALASVRAQATLLTTELAARAAAPAAGRSTGGAAPGASPDSGGSPDSGASPGPGAGPPAVTVGFGSAGEPRVPAAVATARAAGAARVVVAPYLLAPGYFADTLAAAGADLVAAPLGAHPAVVELVLHRAAEAAARW